MPIIDMERVCIGLVTSEKNKVLDQGESDGKYHNSSY